MQDSLFTIGGTKQGEGLGVGLRPPWHQASKGTREEKQRGRMDAGRAAVAFELMHAHLRPDGLPPVHALLAGVAP